MGSERLIVPDTCPGQPTAWCLSCSGQGSSVPWKAAGQQPTPRGRWVS